MYVCVCACMYVCLCVCVCVFRKEWMERTLIRSPSYIALILSPPPSLSLSLSLSPLCSLRALSFYYSFNFFVCEREGSNVIYIWKRSPQTCTSFSKNLECHFHSVLSESEERLISRWWCIDRKKRARGDISLVDTLKDKKGRWESCPEREGGNREGIGECTLRKRAWKQRKRGKPRIQRPTVWGYHWGNKDMLWMSLVWWK